MSQHNALLLLGSNLGDTEKNLNCALKRLVDSGCQIIKKTGFHFSAPVEFSSSHEFCNVAVYVNTVLSPVKLLELIKKIETEMGRTNDSLAAGKYEDRIIDIDIVKFRNLVFHSELLQIPHQKHLFERAFSQVLISELNQMVE